ncbi:MAG TPA: sigma-70 family RNA polymerase sigma factor [Urbifossiella sp.]|nr:sigma-70 family RNA polymerase sigma factor [Urbifossiella sp.]
MIDDRVSVNGDGASTSSSLLAGVKARASGAWGRFATLYRPLVLHWCRQAGLQVADAEDVAQEVLTAAAGAIDGFRHEQPGDTLRGWLRVIARNKILDHARRAARQAAAVGGSGAQRELLAVPAPPAESDESADAAEEAIVLRQAFDLVLAGFKDHTRQAFWRVVVDGQRPEDVAAELDIQVHSVYLAKSRVLRRLQDEFGDLVSRNWGADAGPGPDGTG